MSHNKITGIVIGVRDCGTLVIVFLDAEDGRTVPITMEHRAFQHLLAGEGCDSVSLIGRSISFDGDHLTFLE